MKLQQKEIRLFRCHKSNTRKRKGISILLNEIEQGIITLSTKQRMEDLEHQKSEFFVRLIK